MIVLGLHFGHDAGAAVVVDGEIVSCAIRERRTRVKHAMTLDMETIRSAIDNANLDVGQIDFCAVTSTQGIELIVDDPSQMSIKLAENGSLERFSCPTSISHPGKLSRRVSEELFDWNGATEFETHAKRMYQRYFPEYHDYKKLDCILSGWLDEYADDSLWEPAKTLDGLAEAPLSSELKSEFLRYGFHFPAEVTLLGSRIPGFFVQHHACHAASTYYLSGYNNAAIMVHDGGNGEKCDSGLFYFGDNNRIYPIAPHHSIAGAFYDQVAYFLGLGLSASGKLMGLAAYGAPNFYTDTFVGNLVDLKNRTKEENIEEIVECWLYHCIKIARKLGYNLTHLGDPDYATASINADIAASTQKLFEETTIRLVRILKKYIDKNNVYSENLCVSGGSALNCPTNSRIYRELDFENVFIEPGCDDSGLAIGAALYCFYNLFDNKLKNRRVDHTGIPYFGQKFDESDVRAAIDRAGKEIRFEKPSNWATDAAGELEKNRIVGWFQGRSEIGPRALGHRSILADPRDADNWQKVNDIKGREAWRPFAPMVLETECAKWFAGSPNPSPYMLFNADVISKKLPAITHKDGTARIQTVDETCGDVFRVLEEFFKLTKVPVLLNTSFNGPGEPIVETPSDAIEFFLKSKLDFLYIDGYKISAIDRPVRNNIELNKTSVKKRPAFDAIAFMADFEMTHNERMEINGYSPSPEKIVESYKGFNILKYRGHFFAIKQSIGRVNLRNDLESLVSERNLDDVLISRSISMLRDDIDGLSTSQRIKESVTYSVLNTLRVDSAIDNERTVATLELIESEILSLKRKITDNENEIRRLKRPILIRFFNKLYSPNSRKLNKGQ